MAPQVHLFSLPFSFWAAPHHACFLLPSDAFSPSPPFPCSESQSWPQQTHDEIAERQRRQHDPDETERPVRGGSPGAAVHFNGDDQDQAGNRIRCRDRGENARAESEAQSDA